MKDKWFLELDSILNWSQEQINQNLNEYSFFFDCFNENLSTKESVDKFYKFFNIKYFDEYDEYDK